MTASVTAGVAFDLRFLLRDMEGETGDQCLFLELLGDPLRSGGDRLDLPQTRLLEALGATLLASKLAPRPAAEYNSVAMRAYVA